MVRASVVIVEYNTLRHLPRCLDSLARVNAAADEYEVIVVDNGSPTPARELMERYPSVRLLETGDNLGFAGACNAALPRCSADVVVTLNPDTEVEPGWLLGMLAPFSQSDVGVVGSKIYYPGTGILQHTGGVVLPCGRSEHRGRGERDLGQYDDLADVPYVCGASLAVHRRVIDRVGYFSTAYHPAYYEDTELCIRAWRAGFRVVYTPHAALSHQEHAASDAEALGAFRLSEVSRIRFVARNYSLGEMLGSFLPEEIAFQLAPDRRSAERAISLRAYVDGARTAFRRRRASHS